jgi:hypothetical protein
MSELEHREGVDLHGLKSPVARTASGRIVKTELVIVGVSLKIINLKKY